MNGKKRLAFGSLATAFLALALIGTAGAHGGDRGGNGGGGGPRGGMGGIHPNRADHPIGILRQLVFPCPAACNDTARSCYDTADSEAQACVTAACPAEITAAQTACASDLRSDACKTAMTDLRECSSTCLDTRATAATACREALATCVDACSAD